MEEVKAPGLKWIQRRASRTPVWVASIKDYPGGPTRNLSHLRDYPEQIAAQCELFQAEMNAWKAGLRGQALEGFNGTLGALLERYQKDEESPYHSLRPGSRHPYDYYLAKMLHEVGDKRIDKITGVDLKRWHNSWSDNGEKLAASKMARAVLDAAVTFGVASRLPGCIELREVLKAAGRKLPNPKRRESTVTADQVVKLRAAAHADGRPSSALTYALVFETTLRLWDVIGQWWPLDSALISDVISERRKVKWFGVRWEDIGPDMVLRYVPSKTSAKTGLAITFPVHRAPMVMEELAHWPTDKRTGPLVVYEGTGLPYESNYFGEKWRLDRAAAGISDKVWARDLRASGISEARAAGVATDDAAKVAGHSSTKTTAAIYDRAALEAAERFADARSQRRKAAQS